MTLVDDYTAGIIEAVQRGQGFGDAMRDLTLKHADHLRGRSQVGVLALGSCPRCGGNLIAGETVQKCAAGCEWTNARNA